MAVTQFTYKNTKIIQKCISKSFVFLWTEHNVELKFFGLCIQSLDFSLNKQHPVRSPLVQFFPLHSNQKDFEGDRDLSFYLYFQSFLYMKTTKICHVKSSISTIAVLPVWAYDKHLSTSVCLPLVCYHVPFSPQFTSISHSQFLPISNKVS